MNRTALFLQKSNLFLSLLSLARLNVSKALRSVWQELHAKKFGWQLQYSLMWTFCAGRTAVFWVTVRSCDVSRSDHRFSQRTLSCSESPWGTMSRPFLHALSCPLCFGWLLRSFGYLVARRRWSECLAPSRHTALPSLFRHTFLPCFSARSFSFVFGVSFIRSVTTWHDGAMKPQYRVLKRWALKML